MSVNRRSSSSAARVPVPASAVSNRGVPTPRTRGAHSNPASLPGGYANVPGNVAIESVSQTSTLTTPVLRGASAESLTARRIRTTYQRLNPSASPAQRIRRDVAERRDRMEESPDGQETNQQCPWSDENSSQDKTDAWVALAKDEESDQAMHASWDHSTVTDVCATLKKLAASLDEDKWMYE
ncbi:hypothetical protein Naga_100584g2 [Nannochloropsis gaditana]|uniref:Uncharacterized protein n=1 Tax=Nannochloropsis gaditana TaxID=72520 RepID=W7U3S2_9STRA|nr:hypothetical protein Naga_100584g2 [Nannochloropsis gaditana]